MKTQKSKFGFTLIELLVVIAIIAILAAILFPVFATAREKARQTTCTSNAKQIMIAVLQYNQDFDELYPPNYTYSGSFPLVYWYQLIYPYVKSTGVFLCPSDTNPVMGQGNIMDSYMVNAVMGGSGNPGNVLNAPYFPVTKVVQTATTVYMCEGGAQAGTGAGVTNNTTNDTSASKEGAYLLQDPADPFAQCNITYGVGCSTGTASAQPAWAGPAARHNKFAVVGFCDGHVKSRLPSTWFYNNSPYLNPTIGGSN